jgi:uncharacterized protein (TIGR03067 family)
MKGWHCRGRRGLDTRDVVTYISGMLRCLSLAAVVASLALGVVCPAGVQADDLKAMEGTWKVQSGEAGGKPIDPGDLKGLVVKITGDHYTATTNEGTEAGTVKVDETQNPRTMDATKTEGFEAGKVIKAVYKVSEDGETLTVCYAFDPGAERPTALATKDGVGWILIVYVRER